ncbi:hypothetical protein [Streptomyces olivoreticuli]|uniref:hypothetical protein n=1 Tax=Streptomyces olivoreticuli TaxID=68246 RepID=UPI0013C2C454|nr:hypothetical protein [Streptomyces olivoreticuli]
MRRKVYAPLRRAGLEVLEGGAPETPLPAFAVGAAISCSPETGRRDAYFDYDSPNLVERANHAWYELATSSGLFGTDREFLLALPANRYSAKAASRHRRSLWRRVRLLDNWDVMGAACAIRLGMSEHGYPEHLLGSRAGRTEFAMLSLDSTAVVLGTTWEAGISSLAVPNPGDTEPVQRMLDWAATRVGGPAKSGPWGHPAWSGRKRSHGCGATSRPWHIRPEKPSCLEPDRQHQLRLRRRRVSSDLASPLFTGSATGKIG